MKRWTPLATPILLLAANAPDIDIVTLAGGPLSYLHFHRHLTHALVSMPVMAIGTVALVRLVARKQVRWMGAFLAALIAVASHLLLDWTNTYGIRLLLPFSARWLRLDLLNVFDLWIWGLFLICVAAPFLSRLVGSEIGSKSGPERIHGRGAAWLALVGLTLYISGRGVLHSRAVSELEARIYDGAAPVRTLAVPGPANPWRWKGVVETSDSYLVGDVDLIGGFEPERMTLFRKAPYDPAMEAAMRTPTFQEFLRFSQFPLWRVSPAPDVEGGKLVDVVDLRFGMPPSTAFAVTATVDGRMQVVSSSFQFGISTGR